MRLHLTYRFAAASLVINMTITTIITTR